MYIWECHFRHALHIRLVQVFAPKVESTRSAGRITMQCKDSTTLQFVALLKANGNQQQTVMSSRLAISSIALLSARPATATSSSSAIFHQRQHTQRSNQPFEQVRDVGTGGWLLRRDLTPGVPDEPRMDLQTYSTDDLPTLSSIEFLRTQGSICLVVATGPQERRLLSSARITSLEANGEKHHMLGTVVVVLHLSAPLNLYGVQEASARRPQLSLSPGTPIT